jgi:hypothetical protein
MVNCSLTPKSVQIAVNAIFDGLLVRQLKVYVVEILATIQQIILQVTGIDILQLLFWLTVLTTVIAVYNFVKDVVCTYLCWFKCKDSSSSSCTSSSSKSSCESSSSSCTSSSSSSCGCK